MTVEEGPRAGADQLTNEAGPELLTSEERFIIHELGGIAKRLVALIGSKRASERDVAEAMFHVHGLQRMVMAQAARRAYLHEFDPARWGTL